MGSDPEDYSLAALVSTIWRIRHGRCLHCGAGVASGHLTCGTARCPEGEARDLYAAVWRAGHLGPTPADVEEARRVLQGRGVRDGTAGEGPCPAG